MKAAVARAAAGQQTKLPPRVMFHVVAATYGTTAEAVRSWPIGDYLDAVAFLGITRRQG